MWTGLLNICMMTLFLTHGEAVCTDGPISSQMAEAVNGFSVDLFKEQASQKPDENLVMCPVSASTLLAILQQGAGGDTLTQLTDVLHSDASQSKEGYCKLTKNLKENQENVTLEFANGLFLKEGYQILPNMLAIIQQDFQSDIENVDFSLPEQAADKINLWVANHTHDRIQELISPDAITADTRLVLTNAIYFNGQWNSSFNSCLTTSEPFYQDENSAGKQVQMMHKNDKFRAGELANLDAKWVSLPFQGDRFSMLVIVPNQVNGVNDLIASLTNDDLSAIIESNSAPREVKLSLPKFNITSGMELVEALKQMGLTVIFTDQSDLSGISGEPLAVSGIIQKAEMEVDEQGATASAATAIISVGITSVGVIPPPPLVINANHPFLGFINDKQNSVILFASRSNDPTDT